MEKRNVGDTLWKVNRYNSKKECWSERVSVRGVREGERGRN